LKPAFELADVIFHTQDYIANSLGNSGRVLSALARCRTAALGGHIDQCSNLSCSHIRVSYNSCRNRHCPKCQQIQKETWLMAMEHRTLPVGYFHVVFTIPHELNSLCLQYPKLLYDTLFKVAWSTLKGFAAASQYELKMGMTAVLHTWGQNLSVHPHETVRRFGCIVPAGGMDKDDKWKTLKGNRANGRKGFLYPMEPLKKVYKAKFMAAIRKLIKKGLIPKQGGSFLDSIYQKEWVIYAKRPFADPKQVIEYLGRYTHKVAISNHRLQKVTETHTTFTYKDYADSGTQKLMTLTNEEFIRRFSHHILPAGFTKIRPGGVPHFGLHSGACTVTMDALTLQLTNIMRPIFNRATATMIAKEKSGYKPLNCPCCGQETMKMLSSWITGKPPPLLARFIQ
jgi:hypothetical protein